MEFSAEKSEERTIKIGFQVSDTLQIKEMIKPYFCELILCLAIESKGSSGWRVMVQ